MKKRKTLKLNSLFLVLLVSISSFGQSPNKQKYFAKTFAIGGSFTRIGDVNGDKSLGFHYFNESTININVAGRLSKKFWVGLQIKPVFTKQLAYGEITKSIYNFNGVFGQYDIAFKNGFRLYAESSLNLSDYCTCAKENVWDDPIRKKNILFLGMGGGIELNLNPKNGKSLFLELGFFNYVILNKLQFKYNYTQYILGLNYRFGKLK